MYKAEMSVLDCNICENKNYSAEERERELSRVTDQILVMPTLNILLRDID